MTPFNGTPVARTGAGVGAQPARKERTVAKTIVGLFENRAQAEQLVQHLRAGDTAGEDISLMSPGDTAGDSAGGDRASGVAIGAGTGAALGGLGGLLVGLGALAIPGIGPVLAAGPIAAALAGAAAGAATGGLIGVFTNDGIPKERAEHYSKAITSGSVMLSVHTTQEHVDHASDILHRAGAIDIDEPGEHADTIRASTLPASAIKFDPSTGVRAKQKARERHVDVFPGITGGGPNPTQ